MVICPDTSTAQNYIAAVSAPFDELGRQHGLGLYPPLKLLVQSVMAALSNHDRIRRPDRFPLAFRKARESEIAWAPQPPPWYRASHFYIAVRPAPIIQAAASGLSPTRTRRARGIQRLAIKRGRHLFSCPHGIIRDPPRHEKMCAYL
jgi:hypothetical protein